MPEDSSLNNNVLVRIDRDPLFGMSREEYIARLKTMLEGRVRELFAFGSFTGADFGKFSDIDLIIIADTEKPFIERSFDYNDVLDIIPATDILVYTPSEFRELLNNASTGFWKSVKETMVKII